MNILGASIGSWIMLGIFVAIAYLTYFNYRVIYEIMHVKNP